MPWVINLPGKNSQLIVRELSGKVSEGMTQSSINRLLRICGQVFLGELEAERFIELYNQFPRTSSSDLSLLKFSINVGDLKRPHAGEIACVVAAEKEHALFCSKDEDARSFATEKVLGQDRVFAIQALFTMIHKRGIDLPGDLRSR